MLSLAPILRESKIASDVMKPIAAAIVGGMITSYDSRPMIHASALLLN
jgi:Cu/Ag efflux pump CusA